MTFEDGHTRFYLNGSLDKHDYNSAAQIGEVPGAGLIGAYYTDQNNSVFYGNIDEVAVYNRALTATEVKDHYYAFVNKGMVYSPGAIKAFEES